MFLKQVRRGLFWLVAALVVPGLAAMGQTLTGSIFGTVTDDTGARLPGVTVTISSAQLIAGEEVRVTGGSGTYRVPSLPPGTYTVSFQLQGFQGIRRDGIVLLAGQSLPVDAQLRVAQVEEFVTVRGEPPLVDTRNSGLVNFQNQDTLQNIPVQRQFTELLNIMPGVTEGRYSFSPINNVHGSTVRQNLYNLDGANLTNPGDNTTTATLPVDALQEIQINTAGISAEFGDASGAVINYVTKSGSNEFHGSANHYYQGEGIQGNNLSDELRQQGLTETAGFEDFYDTSATLGGPVRRNRLWFFTSFRYVDISARKPDFRGPIQTDEKQLFSKANFQVSDSHMLDVGFLFRDYLQFPFEAASTFANSADERTWDANSKTNYVFNPRWRAIINENTLFNARGTFSIYKILARSPTNDGSPAYIDLASGIISGGSAQPDGDNRRNRHEVQMDLSHFREAWGGRSHNFKAGFRWGIAPFWFTHLIKGARGDSEIELAGCSARCISETPGVQHLLFNGEPFRVRLWNSPARLNYENRYWTAYVQDEWVINERLTANLGARIDHGRADILESHSGGGMWDPLRVFPDQKGLINTTNIAPRLGAVWDVAGDHKTVIKGSGGRFYAQLIVGYTIPANPAFMGFREFDWLDIDGDLVYDVGEEQLLRLDTRPNPERAPAIDPDFNLQYTDVYTIGVERELGSDLALSVTGIFKRDGDLVGLVNNAVPFSAYERITVTNPLNDRPLEIFTLPSEFLGRRPQLEITNPGERPGDTEKLVRRYDGIEVVLHKRMLDRWQLETSYVWGRGKGNVNNHYGRSDFADYTNPNFLVNRFGDLTMGPRHQFKVHGTFMAPYGVALSGYFEALSGIPLTHSYSFIDPNLVRGAATVRFFQSEFPQILSETFIDAAAEPAGTRKFESQTRLDLRLEKRFDVGLGGFSIIGDVFNVFNSNAAILVKHLRLDNPQFGLPAEIQPPRQVRVGVRWVF